MELLTHIAWFALLNMVMVLLGYLLIRERAVWQSWFLLVISVATANLVFLHHHPVIRMLGIIITTFTAMKVTAVTVSYKYKPVLLKFRHWLVFALGWAGMRAEPFEQLGAKPLPGAAPMIRFGISRVIVGALLILLAHGVIALHFNLQFTYILVTVLLLIGFSLILHFGLLSVSAGTWRLCGVNSYYLFRQPAKSLSLTELWSKRWNLAFSEMTALTVFRPLRIKAGGAVALMSSFVFSGLLHELALSVPVNSGYGLPTLYFVIQGLIVLFEKSKAGRNAGFLMNKVTARLWVFSWLIVPMPLLFHPQFIKQILWPMAGF